MGNSTPHGGGGQTPTGGGYRRCLRPLACPYARTGSRLAGTPDTWARALLDLLPGDQDLALDLFGALVDASAAARPTR